jgi:hypothetical protein
MAIITQMCCVTPGKLHTLCAFLYPQAEGNNAMSFMGLLRTDWDRKAPAVRGTYVGFYGCPDTFPCSESHLSQVLGVTTAGPGRRGLQRPPHVPRLPFLRLRVALIVVPLSWPGPSAICPRRLHPSAPG